MRLVVSGGCGFIGSHVVELLHELGCDVRVLDLRAGEGADVRDPTAWLEALPGADAVCHLAAKVGLGVDFGDARDYTSANGSGTAAMLWAMHESGFAGRLVVASSMVVYGEGCYRCPDHGIVRPGPRSREQLDAGAWDSVCPSCGRALSPEAVTEDAPTNPRNVYAATKLFQEHLCSAFGREHDVPVAALRYHNVYGPRMPRDTPYAGVAAIFLSALRAGRAPQVFEDGGQIRDFVHVRDVARATVLALTSSRPADGALNVASGCPHTVGQMAAALAKACAGPGPVVAGGYRLGDVRHIFASPRRAETVLGFKVQISFEDGMRELAAEC